LTVIISPTITRASRTNPKNNQTIIPVGNQTTTKIVGFLQAPTRLTLVDEVAAMTEIAHSICQHNCIHAAHEERMHFGQADQDDADKPEIEGEVSRMFKSELSDGTMTVTAIDYKKLSEMVGQTTSKHLI